MGKHFLYLNLILVFYFVINLKKFKSNQFWTIKKIKNIISNF